MIRLRELREQKGISAGDFAEFLDISLSYLYQLERGEKRLNADLIDKIVGRFHVSVDWLLGYNGKNFSYTIPLLGTIRAGLPILDQESCGEVEIPADIRADFAVRVIGDSMYWAGISEGDIAVCRDASKVQVRSGQIVAVSLEQDGWGATIKFYYEKGGYRCLRAANPNYKDIPLDGKEYRIAGVVVKFLKEPPALADYERLLALQSGMPEKWQGVVAKAVSAGLEPGDIEQYVDTIWRAALRARRGNAEQK